MRLSVMRGAAHHEKCLNVIRTLHDFELAFNLHFSGLQQGFPPALEGVASKLLAMPFPVRRVWPSIFREGKLFHFATEDLVS